jgi:DNA-binding winged helix-turn-helix (wHTH) protein
MSRQGISTMALKSRTNLRESWISGQTSKRVIEINRNLEIESSPGAMGREQISAPGKDLLPTPAWQEMLEANDYRVALISRSRWEGLEKSGVDRIPPAPPTVLLALSWKELVTRISEFVRESKQTAASKVARFSDFFVDFTRWEVSRLSGELIPMTHQEFKTLSCFLSNPERVLSRDELLNQAWGYENYPTTRTVDTHVAKLRQKLEEDPANPVHFRTVHRVGYKFVP